MRGARGRILVVDDHAEMASLLGEHLQGLGYEVVIARGGAEAIERVRAEQLDLLITDLRMEGVDGFDVLRAAREGDRGCAVIVMTAFGAVDTAVEAMKLGAAHYLTKPFRLDEVTLYVERAMDDRRVRNQNATLRRSTRSAGRTLLGESTPMQRLRELVARVARSDAPVLILGETGTGKELVARALHEGSDRAGETFVPLNCTALPEHLLESELFGHVKGAFTGATSARRGLFVEADGGTIFLDEIGDMPTAVQAKLLRVLEASEVRPVGADVPRKVDVRVLAATHRDLEREVKAGTFRADLYFRLNVVPLSVPALRERSGDIPELIAHFLSEARARHASSEVRALAPSVVAALAAYAWPGNVRELENLVERLVIVGRQATLELADLAIAAPAVAPDVHPLPRAKEEIVPLRQLEDEYIAWVIARCNGNKTRAAELLGIDPSTIHRRARALPDGK